MIVTHKITVDLTHGGEMFRVDVVQGDVNTRAVELTLKEGGVPFPVPDGTAAAVRFRKTDGTGGVYNTMPDGSLAYSISENRVTVYLVPQIMTCPGGVTAEVALSNNGEVLGIFPMRIWVEQDPSVGTVESENYFSFDSLESINAALAGYSSSVDALRVGAEVLEKQIAVERARINQIAHLEQGSTTGDAELADIRVGYDGRSYENAGEAVRGQVADIQSDLYDFREEYLLHPETWESLWELSDSSAWASNKKYSRGTLKGISLYILGNEEQNFEVMLCRDNGDGTAARQASVTGRGLGLVTVECDVYMDSDFYVVIKAPNCAYRKVTGGAYYTNYITSSVFQIPDATGSKFYHAYSLRMLPFAQEKADTTQIRELKEADTGILNRTIKVAETLIRYGTEYADVISLPCNRIYYVHNDVDIKAFGLPVKGYGTLLKYRPYTDERGDMGFVVYDYTMYKDERIEKYYAYGVIGDTVDTLTWKRVSTSEDGDAILNRTIKVAETLIRYGTEYADVISLPCNRIYYVHNDVDIKAFGLPVKGYGTLFKYRPYTDEQGDMGFVVYDYTMYKDGRIEKYYAYGVTGDTVDTLTWKRVSTSEDGDAILNRTIKVAETLIRYGTEYADVISLPCNRIYYVHNNVDNKTFGLPVKGYGTLLKYRPYTDEQEDTGFVVYDYTMYKDGRTEKYYAYSVTGTTVDTLTWQKFNTAAGVPGIPMLGLEDKSIVFIGDSIVEGYGSSDYNGGSTGTSGHLINNNVKTWYRNTGAKCWTNRMIAYLTEHYPGVTACNNGIGGFNVSNVLNNLEILTLDDSGKRADVVVLSVGTNARNAASKYDVIAVQIRKIIHWLLCRGIQPIVLTNSPLYAVESNSLHAENEQNLRCVHSAILRACEEAGVHCYDLLSDFYFYLWEHGMEVSKDTIMADALHPNDLGYEIMFHLIKRLLHV